MAEDSAEDDDTFRILVATDTHVGFCEKNKVRGSDAINTLEEVLQLARSKKADFILHGGDLFHENKPSRATLYQSIEMLRRYCLGSGEVLFEVVSDPTLFGRGLVNYEDANMNVEIPLFMIHGNHDDPGGESNLCAGHLLEVAGLVNYFGRAEDLDDIVIRPVLMRKGRTQLAIYGLGNVRDERLHRAFQARKVRFETPENPENWFNIMILHQNRHKGNKGGLMTKACIHEQMLPSFLDLVLWGHEHDCDVSPQESLRGEFYVVQPGSSVATSLSAGETKLKHVAMIDVKAGCFRCTPVPLWTVRPLVMRDFSLAESGLLRTDTQAIWSALAAEVNAMIVEGEEEVQRRRRELTARGGAGRLEVPALPLVRLRVEVTGFDTVNVQAFGQHFADRIANPDEILLFHRRGGSSGGSTAVGGGSASKKVGALGEVLEIEEAQLSQNEGVKIQDIIYKYIEGEQNLQILSEPDLNDAVQSFVHQAEPCAIERFVREAVEATNEAVMRESRAVGEEEIRVQIQDRAEGLRQQRLAAAAAGGTGAGPESVMPVSGTGMPGSQAPLSVDVDGHREVESRTAGRGGQGLGLRPNTQGQAASLELAPEPSSQGTASRGRGRGRGRGRQPKRSQEDLGVAGAFGSEGMLQQPAKAARNVRNTVARAAACPPDASLQGRGGRGAFFGEAGAGVAVDSQGFPAGAAGAPAAATFAEQGFAEVAAATPFLQKRGGAPVEPPRAVDTSVENNGNSLRLSQATTTKRQWALRGPSS